MLMVATPSTHQNWTSRVEGAFLNCWHGFTWQVQCGIVRVGGFFWGTPQKRRLKDVKRLSKFCIVNLRLWEKDVWLYNYSNELVFLTFFVCNTLALMLVFFKHFTVLFLYFFLHYFGGWRTCCLCFFQWLFVTSETKMLHPCLVTWRLYVSHVCTANDLGIWWRSWRRARWSRL